MYFKVSVNLFNFIKLMFRKVLFYFDCEMITSSQSTKSETIVLRQYFSISNAKSNVFKGPAMFLGLPKAFGIKVLPYLPTEGSSLAFVRQVNLFDN